MVLFLWYFSSFSGFQFKQNRVKTVLGYIYETDWRQVCGGK